MALKFTESEIPNTGRVYQPSQFRPLVDNLNSNRDKSMTSKATADEAKELVKAMRRDADNIGGISVRAKVGGGTVTVWVVDKITRQRKTADEN